VRLRSRLDRVREVRRELEAPMTTPATKLERKENRASLTHVTLHAVYGRREGGAFTSFTLTSMTRIIRTFLPVFQPDGRLVIPPDAWAALRAIIDDEGGSLDVEESTLRGFHFGSHSGLPVYDLRVNLPDGVDQAELMERLHPALKTMIRRNLTTETNTQPA
jgi:hypothetical protein